MSGSLRPQPFTPAWGIQGELHLGIWTCMNMFIFLPLRNSPRGSGPPHFRGFMITLKHTTLGRTLDEGSAQRPLPDNTLLSQETDINDPGGIRTHNPSKERPQTHALDRVATGIGVWVCLEYINQRLSWCHRRRGARVICVEYPRWMSGLYLRTHRSVKLSDIFFSTCVRV